MHSPPRQPCWPTVSSGRTQALWGPCGYTPSVPLPKMVLARLNTDEGTVAEGARCGVFVGAPLRGTRSDSMSMMSGAVG